MLRNYLTILVIPQKKGRVVRFELSSLFVKIVLLFLGTMIAASVGISLDYFIIKEKNQRLREYEKNIILQKFKIQEISNQLSDKHQQLENYEEFDRKLRLISGLQESATRIRYIGRNGDQININESDSNAQKILTKLKKTDFNSKLREISFFQLGAYLQEGKVRLARTPSIAPTKGYLSSRYGRRVDPFTGKKRAMHMGLDFANRQYTPIYAPADGVIVNTYVNGNLGEFLVIDHGYHIVTRYGHLSKYEVRVGQHIKRGDLIARMGNTGRSTASHLHYEILVNDQYVNPEKYLLE